ncbi:ion transporter [Candidatus Uhrbacteria bacterium]|nr:ion transporter [Candidatus Uhrbacteria bacterium]
MREKNQNSGQNVHEQLRNLLDPHRKKENFRKQLWEVLHHGRGHTGHAYNFLLVLMILLSLAILPLELLSSFQRFHFALNVIEIATTSIFTVEYLLHIWAAPKRLRYMFSLFGIIDLLSILPFYAGLFGTQYIKALRLIRLVRIGEIDAAAAEDEEAVMEEGIGITGEETVEYIVTHHPIFLFIGCLPPILATTVALMILLLSAPGPIPVTAGLTLFFFALLFLWKAWLDFSYDVIFITSQRLIWQNQHILGRSINQVNFHAITNVRPYYPSLVSYIMRYGSLIIETAAGDEPGRIVFHVVRDHEKAAHKIMHKCFGSRKKD